MKYRVVARHANGYGNSKPLRYFPEIQVKFLWLFPRWKRIDYMTEGWYSKDNAIKSIEEHKLLGVVHTDP